LWVGAIKNGRRPPGSDPCDALTYSHTHTHTRWFPLSRLVGFFIQTHPHEHCRHRQTRRDNTYIPHEVGGGGGGASHRSALEDHKLQVRRIYLSTADRTASQTGTQQAGRPLTQYKEGGRQMCVGWFTSRQRDRWMDGWSDAVMPSVCIMYACMHVCVCMYVCMR